MASVFDHPILFDAFAGSIFALVYQVLGYRKNLSQRFSMITVVEVTSMMSLSSGLKGLDAKLEAHRTGSVIAMTAFFVVAWTVHFWDASYALMLFLLGSGVRLLDVKPASRPALEAQRA